ncbi:MAG: hypothetical protein PHU98_14570 [Mariniphaga sp.]|nr:hypothetical protein [Mariniphaga sp.]
MITKLCSFGSRGSQVRILLPRQLKIKELESFLTPFFLVRLKHG